jgi:uncharacterized membrane protein YfhO
MPKITKKSEQSALQNPKLQSKAKDKKYISALTKPDSIKTSIDDYIGKNGLLLAVSLIILISFIVFKDFIFMKFIYMFKDFGSDSINVDYPLAVLNQNMFANQHYFTWTFYSGMGYPMNSGIATPLHPLVSANTILVPIFKLIFGSNPAFLKFPIFLSILVLIGITAYLYFKTLNYSSFVSGIGSLMVSFMGYTIASSAWNHYYDVFGGIFLLFAFEQYYKKQRWYFIPIAVMMISYNFFNVYVYGTFLVTYFIFRYFSDNSSLKKIVPIGLKIIGLSAWGLVLGVANFFPNLINAWNSPRVSESIDAIKDISQSNPLIKNHIYELSTALLRTFSSDMMGTGNHFNGWYNYLEAPMFYCSILSLLLIAQVFSFLNKKDKILFGSFAGFWLAIVLFPQFRYAFHLFIGNYYKVGINFFIPIVLIFYAIKSLSLIIEHKKINVTVLIISFIVLIFALFYPYSIENIELTQKTIRNYAALLLIAYAGLIYFLSLQKYQLMAQIGIIAILTIELTGFSSITVSKRENYSASEFRISEGGYKDNSLPALDYIKNSDKNFYRVEKEYSSANAMHGSLNDSQVQGYFGTCLYSSFNQPYYIDFLREADIIKAGSETGTRWAPGLRSRPLLQTVASVKYNLSKSDKPFMLNAGYSSMNDFGDVKLLKNEYFIPFGYCYSSYITKSDFQKCSSLQKDVSLLRAFVIDENTQGYKTIKSTFKQFKLSDTVAAFDFEKYKSYVEQRRKDTLKITEFNQNVIKGNLTVDSAKMFFASIPFDKEWKVKIDGQYVETQVVNIGFLGFGLLPGSHTIEMEYFPGYVYWTIGLTIIASLVYILLLFVSKEIRIQTKLGIFGICLLVIGLNLF